MSALEDIRSLADALHQAEIEVSLPQFLQFIEHLEERGWHRMQATATPIHAAIPELLEPPPAPTTDNWPPSGYSKIWAVDDVGGFVVMGPDAIPSLATFGRKFVEASTEYDALTILRNEHSERRKLIAKTAHGPVEFDCLSDEIPF